MWVIIFILVLSSDIGPDTPVAEFRSPSACRVAEAMARQEQGITNTECTEKWVWADPREDEWLTSKPPS